MCHVGNAHCTWYRKCSTLPFHAILYLIRLQCAELSGIDFQVIEECYNSVAGHILLHEVGLKQKALNTSVYWVPWILINDVSIVLH